MTQPLCKDCKHFVAKFRACKRIVQREFEPVYGETTHEVYKDADVERRNRGFFEFGKSRCGPEGRFFEAIDKPSGPPPVCGSRASIPLKSTPTSRALFDESIAERNRKNMEEQLAAQDAKSTADLLNAAHAHNVADACDNHVFEKEVMEYLREKGISA